MRKVQSKTLGFPTKGLNAEIAEILARKREPILDQFYQAYCQYISEKHPDERKRDIEYLKKVCIPVRNRFSILLDRFITFLTTENGDYDISESERDVEYAARFLVPARYKDLASHDVVKMTRTFVQIATHYVLTEVTASGYTFSAEAISNLMNELIYITFEDLWVSSVAAFRHHHRVIQGLLSKIMKAQEKERQSFARELHDDLLQVLAVIPIRLQIVEELCDKDVSAVRNELKRLRDLVNESIQEVRNLCYNLHSFWVEKKGLIFSLSTFVKRIEREFGISVALEIKKEVEQAVNGFPGVTLFRIIQEALYNIGKHSNAKQAKVKIDIDGGKMTVVIEDDGIGFDPQKAFQEALEFGHFGIISMRERAKLLGGRLQIRSERGVGTQVTISLPFNRA